MSGRFEGHDPSEGHDTAGVPWKGRTLSGTGFDLDQGRADPALMAALARPEDEVALLAAIAAARLLVPMVAVPHENDPAGGTDMATVTLTAPDGRRAMPVFTSVETLSSWDPAARPVPVAAQRAAQAAIQEGCQVLVLDLPEALALRPSMVWALAMGRPWQPGHTDPDVARAVAAAVQDESAVADHRLAEGEGGALQIVVSVRPGLDQGALAELLTRVGEQLATDGEVRARIDAVSFRVVPDESAD